MVHAGLGGTDLTACAVCHPATITAGGAIDVAGGHHVNGTVDRIGGHAAGYAARSAHGSQYLDRLAGAAGAVDCTSCHGATLAFCDACHGQSASGGWVSWRTNCTFCHGARTPAYRAGDLVRAAPPDAVSQRLTGVAAPTRTGNHLAHLSGRAGFPSLPCASCHAVPATIEHVRLDRRAPVAFDAGAAFTTLGAQELAALPTPLATYSPSTGQCGANYCHGGGLPGGTSTTPAWASDAPPIADCTTCHGAPAASAATLVGGGDLCATTCNLHVGHANAFGCAVCHAGSAPANTAGRHVDGSLDVAWGAGITGTWDPQAKTCGVSCHSDVVPRGWK
jgi:predicted CxxxxCH...CXXCH cytochrome family protein